MTRLVSSSLKSQKGGGTSSSSRTMAEFANLALGDDLAIATHTVGTDVAVPTLAVLVCVLFFRAMDSLDNHQYQWKGV